MSKEFWSPFDVEGWETMSELSEETKNDLRKGIIIEAGKLIGVPYKLGGKWDDISKPPETLDCSGLVSGLYKLLKLSIPDGSQNQFNYTIATTTPKIGDICFMGRDKDITKIYHCGILFSEKDIIEAREFDGREWTGKVCLRQRNYWEEWKNFVGYRCHPKLI